MPGPFWRSILAVLVGSTIALQGQTFRGGVAGTVTDESGATVQGARARLVSNETGLTRDVESSSAGEFTFQDLPLGTYTLTVVQPGFRTLRVDNIRVEAGRLYNLPVKLSVAAQATTVDVAATALAIETSSSALTSVIPTKAIVDIPLNGRDFTQLLRLNPGVNAAGSVNGTRTNSINWTIDGADNNDLWHNSAAVNQGGVSGVAGVLLPIDAIDQFSVQTNANAESARNGGGSSNIVIKSGTNTLHGSAFYFNRNEALSAKNWFVDPNQSNPKLRNHQFGGSLGGPIWRNHTFFFLTYEEQLFTAGNTNQDTTPSAAWVNQATSVLNRYSVPVNPVSVNLLSLWPARTRTGPATSPNYFSSDDNDYNSYNAIIKLDHIFNERNNIAVRYFGGTGSQTAYVGSALKDYYQVAPSRMHNFSLVYNRVISPRFVSQLVAGANYFKQTFNDFNTSFNPVALGLNTGVTERSLLGSPDVLVGSFSETGLTPPLGRIDVTGHLDQTFTYSAGTHQFRFGAEYRRARLDVFYERNKRGAFTFDGSQGPWAADPTVNANTRALADFLAGYVPAQGAVIAYGDLQRIYYVNSTSAFFQDAWRVSPKLTLNYGLNWIFQSPPSDPTNRISTFIPSKGGITYVGNGITTLYPRDWHDFAPRFGFAYQPRINGPWVVRGGYGLYYQVPNLNYMVDNRPKNGGASGVLANPGALAPVYTLSNQQPIAVQYGVSVFGPATLPPPPYGAFSISQHFVTGYVQSYNLNAQYQLGSNVVIEGGYTGSLSRHLPVTLDVNQKRLGGGSRPYAAQFPALAAINEVQSVGNGYYNGAIVSVRGTNFHRFTTQLNYTYGFAKDDLSAARNTNPTNSYDLRADYGNADFDVRHSFSGFLSYDLPQPTRFRLLLGGWQLNSLLTFNSGRPFTVLAGRDRSQTGERKDRVNVVADPFQNVPSALPHQAIYWFNPAAFQQPALGTYGNERRNQFYGPETEQVDFSVFKQTPITERVTTQLRFELFNLFNRRNLAPPNTSLAGSSVGQVNSTLDAYNGAPGIGTGSSFNLQLALKVLF